MTQAETQRYVLEIPPGQTVRYELELEPRHAGDLSVRAEWEGKRMVSIRLEPPPSAGTTVRRNGPSPLHIAAEVAGRTLAGREPWRLTVRSPAGREGAEGVLTIVLPEPAPKPRPRLIDDAVPIDPWAAWRMPDDAQRSWSHFDDWAHRLRAKLLAEERGDACRWQGALLEFIERTRRELIEHGTVPSKNTRATMRIIASAVDDVEELRESDDPFIAGPFPDEPRRRAAYMQIRSRQLAPLEAKLDEVLMRIGRDHAPDLVGEDWPVRLVSCVTACERYFAEAPVVGEDEAPNADLARAQWDRLVEAARTLFALADVEPAP